MKKNAKKTLNQVLLKTLSRATMILPGRPFAWSPGTFVCTRHGRAR